MPNSNVKQRPAASDVSVEGLIEGLLKLWDVKNEHDRERNDRIQVLEQRLASLEAERAKRNV